MKILIVYATGSGCARETAAVMVEELSAMGHEPRLEEAKTAPNPTGFDLVVAGSGVRAGHWHKSLGAWLGRHRAALADRPLAVFTVCLMMRNPEKHQAEVQAIGDTVLGKLDLKPVAVGLFPGWFLPERFGFLERLILRMMKTPAGDFRDLEAVRAWIRGLPL